MQCFGWASFVFPDMDCLNKEQRHKCMSKVKNKNTRPEIIVRKYLFSKGLRYRIAPQTILGKPDIVLPKYKTLVFVNGCFWHGHKGCKGASLPQTNATFWKEKIDKNVLRDAYVIESLKNVGWKVITIWQCELKPAMREFTLNKLYNDIKNSIHNECK